MPSCPSVRTFQWFFLPVRQSQLMHVQIVAEATNTYQPINPSTHPDASRLTLDWLAYDQSCNTKKKTGRPAPELIEA